MTAKNKLVWGLLCLGLTFSITAWKRLTPAQKTQNETKYQLIITEKQAAKGQGYIYTLFSESHEFSPFQPPLDQVINDPKSGTPLYFNASDTVNYALLIQKKGSDDVWFPFNKPAKWLFIGKESVCTLNIWKGPYIYHPSCPRLNMDHQGGLRPNWIPTYVK